jgi:hypothetical protein
VILALSIPYADAMDMSNRWVSYIIRLGITYNPLKCLASVLCNKESSRCVLKLSAYLSAELIASLNLIR